MTDRFDAWLETGLRDLEAAVPLGDSMVGRLAPTELVRVSGRRTRSLRPVGPLALAIALLILVAAVLVPRFNAAGPAASQSIAPSTGGSTVTPSPLSSAAVPDERTIGLGPFSIVVPSSWHMVTHTVGTTPGPFIFLGNVAIADPCPTKFLGVQCLRPLAELPPDGIVVTFDGSTTTKLPNPTPIPTNEPLGSACAGMAGERELAVLFQGFGVTACLRGPDFAANEAAFNRLVASIPGPPPPAGTRVTVAFTIPESGITLSPPGDAVPATSSDAAYELCLTPGGASCQPSPPTSIQLALITDTSSGLVKPGTLVWAMSWLGVTTCVFSGGGPGLPGSQAPVATPGQPLCDAYTFVDAHSGKFIFGYAGPHH